MQILAHNASVHLANIEVIEHTNLHYLCCCCH